MEVRKFRARTIKEATDRVKDSLGPDAMIISTKRLKEKETGHLFEISAVPKDKGGPLGTSDQMGELKSELMSIKEMIYLLNHSDHVLEKLMVKPEILSLYAKLVRSGIKESYVKMFLERAGAFNGHHIPEKNEMASKVIREMKRFMDLENPFSSGAEKRPITAFVGTTGVGKTTTIAKLAARLMIEEKKKVGLISIDTYRIGAMEQLKTYANILGVPCFQAFKRKDLKVALQRMEGKDAVLIDTAGQSQYDKARIDELREVMTNDLDISTHLLLSLNTTESEMNRTALNFSPLNFKSYVFTKIDEVKRCGALINQIMALSRPISFITNGQNVPEDIEKAERESLLKYLLHKK